MTGDDLLASAFRKILGVHDGSYHYVAVGDPAESERLFVTLDSTWTEEDGLTPDEFAAILQATAS